MIFAGVSTMPGDWVSIAISSAAVIGLVNIIDSHLISKRMPSLRAYLIPMGSFVLVYGVALFCLFPLPEEVGTWPLIVAIASGVLRATAIIIMLYTKVC